MNDVIPITKDELLGLADACYRHGQNGNAKAHEKLKEIYQPKLKPESVNHLIDLILGILDVSYKEFIAKKRPGHLVRARTIVAYCIYKHYGLKAPKQRSYFNRDHGTIYHYIQEFPYRYKTDSLLQEQFDKVYERIDLNID